MRALAILANVAWNAAGLPATLRFHRALATPDAAQRSLLLRLLARDARTRFGEEHDFAGIRDAATFARRVPMTTWDDLAGSVARIRAGEPGVLCSERVTHLVPTSGTQGARKLIPFTRGLASSFHAAIAPWIADLARQRPALLLGPAYWSVSPLADEGGEDDRSAVPVGFADDADYLGGTKAWLVRQVLPVPSSVRFVRDDDAFWRLTLLALLRQRELRLISAWHPSFVELLVSAAEPAWTDLLEAIESGTNPWIAALPEEARPAWRLAPDRARAAELREAGATAWPRWWPRLQVVSCWGEQAAESGWRRLAARLPGMLVQRKGLLATEAVVTVPIGDELPLAVTSHFFEFLCESGDVRLAHELEQGRRYEVVVTNGAGLWRYRLGDVVECAGRVGATPSLRFLGRAGAASDLRGEKLSEAFVAEALRALWPDGARPSLARLRAWDDGFRAGYDLELSSDATAEVAERLEQALLANPHYALARRLGQLAPLRSRLVARDEAEELRAAARHGGQRLGDVKPTNLVRATAPPA